MSGAERECVVSVTDRNVDDHNISIRNAEQAIAELQAAVTAEQVDNHNLLSRNADFLARAWRHGGSCYGCGKSFEPGEPVATRTIGVSYSYKYIGASAC